MTLFWIICAALLIVALLFVVLPLWRKTGKNNDVLRDAANLEILRDQSAELDADLRNGMLTQDAYEQGKRELQARLLEEVNTAEQPVKPPRNPAKILAVALVFLLPLSSVLLYRHLGNTMALLPQQQGAAGSFEILRSEASLQKLEKELEKRPENPDGWWMLARSYTELRRFPEAARAYQHLVELVPNEAQLWASYADIYAMAHDRTLQGEVIKFLDKALALDANNMTALALSGNSAMERGDYAAAINHWQKLIGQLPPDSQDAQMILRGIQQAHEFLASQKDGKAKSASTPPAKAAQPKPGAAGSQLSGKVSLSPALAGKVAPTDTVFIMARAAEGTNMPPLAALRKQVKDLPLQFTLDDSMAMQSQLKLSGFDQVVVVARVSKSGTPKAQPGDLQGVTGAVKSGAKDVNVVIDSVVQ
ncbi:MAG: c-type cytochrome biogenesis protein CcmI [Gallionella sp.]|nr:MAG: c-type cytochrome biogenesis protein CcmI [Gallionella sp.]